MLVWVVAVGWSLAYTRTVAIGAAMAGPLVVAALIPRWPAVTASRPERTRLTRRTRRTEGGVVAGAAPGLRPRGRCRAARRVPGGGAGCPWAWVRPWPALPAGTVVVDEYGLGGWLRYRHPDLGPVIDERTELFSVDLRRGATSRPGRPDQVGRTPSAATAPPPPSCPSSLALADALPRELGWRSLGEDNGYVLLAARAPVPA